MKIEIYDPAGNLVNSISAPKVKGLNRADWPMRLAPPRLPPATSMQLGVVGPRVPEGSYTYKLVKGNDTFEGTCGTLFRAALTSQLRRSSAFAGKRLLAAVR